MGKKTVILCCPTLKKELLAALKEYNNDAEVIFLPDGLHNDPRVLHSHVQKEIDRLVDIERVIVCPSGCGGGTIGLVATNCELVIPRTRDCLDILLSGESLKDIYRPKHGVFMTDSWMEYSKRSSIAVPKVEERLGKEGAAEFLRKLYKGFEHFYIIDTGVYDVASVAADLEPLRAILDGTVDYMKGSYGILKKIAQERFDEDFLVLQKGEEIPKSYFTIDRDL